MRGLDAHILHGPMHGADDTIPMVCPHGHEDRIVAWYFELGGWFPVWEEEAVCWVCGDDLAESWDEDAELAMVRRWNTEAEAERAAMCLESDDDPYVDDWGGADR